MGIGSGSWYGAGKRWKERRVSEEFADEDSDFFIGGVILPWGTSVGRPAIWMTITETLHRWGYPVTTGAGALA